MVNEMRFYYKDYKNAIQIQGIIPAYDIDFYFSSKKQYQQFKEDYEFSQPKELKVQQALGMLPEYKKGYDAGRVEGAKQELEWIKDWIEHWFEEFDLDGREISYKATDSDLKDMINEINKRLKELEKGGKE